MNMKPHNLRGFSRIKSSEQEREVDNPSLIEECPRLQKKDTNEKESEEEREIGCEMARGQTHRHCTAHCALHFCFSFFIIRFLFLKFVSFSVPKLGFVNNACD